MNKEKDFLRQLLHRMTDRFIDHFAQLDEGSECTVQCFIEELVGELNKSEDAFFSGELKKVARRGPKSRAY